MTTKRIKVALFYSVQFDFEAIFKAGTDGQEIDIPDYARLSEWIEIDFPLLPENDLQARKTREVEAVRARLQKQLAELDNGGAK